jgi:hypothetical protein
MSTHTIRAINWLAILLVGWWLLIMTPLSWWGFSAGNVIVGDTTTEDAAPIIFERTIWRDIRLRYSVIVRRVDGNEVVCDASSSVFNYRAGAKLPDHLDMAWWAPGDGRCARLFPPGGYVMTTCWTAPGLLMGVLPPKTKCVTSNVFQVRAPK